VSLLYLHHKYCAYFEYLNDFRKDVNKTTIVLGKQICHGHHLNVSTVFIIDVCHNKVVKYGAYCCVAYRGKDQNTFFDPSSPIAAFSTLLHQ